MARRTWITLAIALAAGVVAASLAGAAAGAATSFDRTRTILFNGEPTFPLVL